MNIPSRSFFHGGVGMLGEFVAGWDGTGMKFYHLRIFFDIGSYG